MNCFDSLPTTQLPIPTQPVLSLCMTGDFQKARQADCWSLVASHVFWVSGFGERPAERGGFSSVGYPWNRAYSGWFLQNALPSLGKGKAFESRTFTDRGGNSVPWPETIRYTLTHLLYVYTNSPLMDRFWSCMDILYYFNTSCLLTFYFIWYMKYNYHHKIWAFSKKKSFSYQYSGRQPDRQRIIKEEQGMKEKMKRSGGMGRQRRIHSSSSR